MSHEEVCLSSTDKELKMFTNRLLKVFAFFILAVIASASWRPAYAQSMLVVDDDGQASATDCNAPRFLIAASRKRRMKLYLGIPFLSVRAPTTNKSS
jgi:hypothetical protein